MTERVVKTGREVLTKEVQANQEIEQGNSPEQGGMLEVVAKELRRRSKAMRTPAGPFNGEEVEDDADPN